MYPVRGQTVLIRAPHIKVCKQIDVYWLLLFILKLLLQTQRYIDGIGLWTYIIPRDDGTVICGGTVDTDNDQTSPDEAITKSILERAYRLNPDLTHGKGFELKHFDIISVNVGFRPARRGGIRLEKETRRKYKLSPKHLCKKKKL